jgi:hypothetical protein
LWWRLWSARDISKLNTKLERKELRSGFRDRVLACETFWDQDSTWKILKHIRQSYIPIHIRHPKEGKGTFGRF